MLLPLTALSISAEESGDWYWQILEFEDPFEEKSYSCIVVSHDHTKIAVPGQSGLAVVNYAFSDDDERELKQELIDIRAQDYRSCEMSAGEFDYCPKNDDIYEDVTIEAIINDNKVRFRGNFKTDQSSENTLVFAVPAVSNEEVAIVYRILFPVDEENPEWQREVFRNSFSVLQPLTALEKLDECSKRESERKSGTKP